MNKAIYELVEERSKALGYPSVMAYVFALVAEDLKHFDPKEALLFQAS